MSADAPRLASSNAAVFHLEPGRLCVLAFRHRHACVMVARAGIRELLDAHPVERAGTPWAAGQIPDGRPTRRRRLTWKIAACTPDRCRGTLSNLIQETTGVPPWAARLSEKYICTVSAGRHSDLLLGTMPGRALHALRRPPERMPRRYVSGRVRPATGR
ncbi:hypothetical protein GCM10009662_01160 [Catellatospora coxensis]|uniref:Uncharacterized protein n=1 Tax=Catellatospora coxensis TaxID=310354 RepID=A0A8J3KV43_9ACTN|nr:hypothetical protein Cco03nite_04410 [Catellatospora coxensis]